MLKGRHASHSRRQGYSWTPPILIDYKPLRSLRDLRDQLLGDSVAEGIEVLRDGDERAGAANDIVAIVVCKPARRADVAGIELGLRLAQGDEPRFSVALGDRYT